jgi:uncharacterized membrane protein YjfL (UPF0719 family)
MDASQIIYSVSAFLLCAGILLLGRVAYAKLAKYDVDHELTEADNPAVGTALFGFLAGLVIVMVALLGNASADLEDPVDVAWELAEFAVYGALAVLLLKLAGWINDRIILHRFENQKELVNDRNVGAGAALAGSYIACGLVLAGSLSGQVDPSLLPEGKGDLAYAAVELSVALAFFALAQLVLAAYGLIYQAIQKEDVHDAIERDYTQDGVLHGGNMAAGIAFGGNLAAVGVILYGATAGDFHGWVEHLTGFGITVGVGLLLLPVWRVFVDKVMLSKADLNKEIYEDRNVNAALLETVCMLGLAAVIVLVF